MCNTLADAIFSAKFSSLHMLLACNLLSPSSPLSSFLYGPCGSAEAQKHLFSVDFFEFSLDSHHGELCSAGKRSWSSSHPQCVRNLARVSRQCKRCTGIVPYRERFVVPSDGDGNRLWIGFANAIDGRGNPVERWKRVRISFFSSVRWHKLTIALVDREAFKL